MSGPSTQDVIDNQRKENQRLRVEKAFLEHQRDNYRRALNDAYAKLVEVGVAIGDIVDDQPPLIYDDTRDVGQEDTDDG